MGPRCSSAETQVCHRSYIIAANITRIIFLSEKNIHQNIIYDNFDFMIIIQLKWVIPKLGQVVAKCSPFHIVAIKM